MANNNKDAKAQVEAFLEVLKEQHDLDENKIARIVSVAQKNGKMYVTWAWIISILLVLVSFLAVRQLDSIDRQLEAFAARQSDVRERLRVLEQMMSQHLKDRGGP